MVNITSKIQEVVKKEGKKSGICHVFVPHTTAGLSTPRCGISSV